MSAKSACTECIKANKNRTKDGKIRCTKYSKWVYPFEDSCEEYVCECRTLEELSQRSYAAMKEISNGEKEMNSGKWLFDGDCLICNCCGKAIDYHPQFKWGVDQDFIVPASCPTCGDEKTEVYKE